MKEADLSSLILLVLGLAVGAMAVYIYLSQSMRTTVTDLTRDSEGRIISIVERKL